MNNKFCFIYGSFNENGFRRRSAGSDIDIICQNMDEYEVRRQLKKAFPKSDIDMNTVKIDISKADVKSEDNSEIIRATMCAMCHSLTSIHITQGGNVIFLNCLIEIKYRTNSIVMKTPITTKILVHIFAIRIN